MHQAPTASADREKKRGVAKFHFRPAVLVQQIFSLIKQSPTGSVRFADVRRIAPPEVDDNTIRHILGHLNFEGFLQPGRLGEWRPDTELQELIDRHDIYSNIGAELLAATAVEAYSGKVIGRSARLHEPGTVLLVGGRPMEVVWQEEFRFGLAPTRRSKVDDILRLRKTKPAVPYAVAQMVAQLMEVGVEQMPLSPAGEGVWLFHFWGTLWGELLASLLVNSGVLAESFNEYCLFLGQTMTQLPEWERDAARQASEQAAVSLAGRLQMGRFYRLLPPNVALAAATKMLNLEQFESAYRAITVMPAVDYQEALHGLIGG